MLSVRWYLRYNLSYRDLEELLAERGIDVDHVTLFRWVQRFTPLLIDAARPCRHSVGRRWFVDETYVKVAGVWRYVYRAVDNDGQIIDVFVSPKRDNAAATKFFAGALLAHGRPVEVVTDKAPALEKVIEKLLPMVPFLSASCFASANPRPAPSEPVPLWDRERDWSSRTNGRKILSPSTSGIPGPWSTTWTRNALGVG